MTGLAAATKNPLLSCRTKLAPERGVASRKSQCQSWCMKLFRYRRPGCRQLTGYTTAKRRVRRDLGISQVEAWTKPARIKQRVKAKVGLYSPAARIIRQTARGNFPTLLGLFGRKRR